MPSWPSVEFVKHWDNFPSPLIFIIYDDTVFWENVGLKVSKNQIWTIQDILLCFHIYTVTMEIKRCEQ